ncbi:MAG TPA: DNA repair protein RadC [Vicinamibacterales bacterium]|nr:DNA repair protein RadC [Vicinamibacterales bacterium]
MKHLSPGDRPREKFRRHGAAALGDNELVALVLGSGRRSVDALGVANELLRDRGGLHGLARSSCEELTWVAGVGAAKAVQVLAALEAGRRTLTHAPADRPQLRSPRAIAEYLMPAFGSKQTEHFGVVLLDSKYRVLRTSVVAIGTLNSAAVEPREVFREAIVGAAAAIVVFHNHPSGDPTPSHDDEELTRRLRASGTLIGIDLVDHVVLGDARYCSLKEMGRF